MSPDTESLISNRDVDRYDPPGATKGVTILEQEAAHRQQQQWDSSIDVLLAWLHEAGRESDARAVACIETALDLANDLRSALVPTSIAQTAEGGVALEWRPNDDVVTVEIIASDRAELTHFRSGRVIREESLDLSPRTRRLWRQFLRSA